MIKTKYYFHQQRDDQIKKPIRRLTAADSSLPKVKGKEIYLRTLNFTPKRIIQFKQPEQLQFWGLVHPIQDLPVKPKEAKHLEIIKHRFNSSKILLEKYMDSKQVQSNHKIQTPTTLKTGPIYAAKTSRTCFSVKKRKLSTWLPSTSMSENQANETQEFFKKFDSKSQQQQDVSLFKGIIQISNMGSQKKYQNLVQKNFRRFRKYSQDHAKKNIWNQEEQN